MTGRLRAYDAAEKDSALCVPFEKGGLRGIYRPKIPLYLPLQKGDETLFTCFSSLY
jgi:hypothetical protein